MSGNKLNLLVLFGGVSSEHEVSCMSAASILEYLDPDRFTVHTVGITKTGRFLLTPATAEMIRACQWADFPLARPCTICCDRERRGLIVLSPDRWQQVPIDCVFPALHGKNGEDGTIQGLLEISGLPYVGCGVAASANAMDKSVTKLLAAEAGVTQARWRLILRDDFTEDPEAVTKEIMREFGSFPLFVKPARAGSSVGISKATDEMSLVAAIALAAAEDEKVLIEEFIPGRELEVSVLGNDNPTASLAGEILPSGEFYDYNAKYIDGKSGLVIPAELSEDKMLEIRNAAVDVFRAVGARGLSRVDFFLKDDGTLVFNEINTMPGFTSISMYPKLFEYMGIPYRDLLTFLVELALEGHDDR